MKATKPSPAIKTISAASAAPTAGLSLIDCAMACTGATSAPAATNDTAARARLPPTWTRDGGASSRPKQPHDSAPVRNARNTATANAA